MVLRASGPRPDEVACERESAHKFSRVVLNQVNLRGVTLLEEVAVSEMEAPGLAPKDRARHCRAAQRVAKSQ